MNCSYCGRLHVEHFPCREYTQSVMTDTSQTIHAEIERHVKEGWLSEYALRAYIALLARERHEALGGVARLMAENTLLLGQRERAMQAARWLRSYRPSAKQFKAASAELDALEKEVEP